MLELRPSCENCKEPLPPGSTRAVICSFECTFCVSCANGLLQHVCPNCAGNLVPRPIRPQKNWKGGNFLENHPAGTRLVERRVNADDHRLLLEQVKQIAPERR